MGQITTNCMKKDRFFVLSDNTGRFFCKSKITGQSYYTTPNPSERFVVGDFVFFYNIKEVFKTSDNWSDYNELIGYGTNPIQKAIDADIEFEKVQPKI